MDNKFVAIKLHFGELGNLGYLRPNYAKAMADVVKETGGNPFLTDCNTLIREAGKMPWSICNVHGKMALHL